jgi:hypothetical protein
MRLVRHLSFGNVIAVIALFVALGGAAYAGSKINGKNIVNASIGGGKLKNETITAKKIKKGTITGAQIQEGSINSNTIDLSTLGTVPSANTASTATSATTAQSATSAQTATTAGTATSAETAKHADEADRATIAGEAEKLEGETATQLTVSCPSTTEFYGGMCWDKTTRQGKFWLVAIKECGEEGGRLPTIGELIAFVLRPGEQVEEQVWSGDLADIVGPAEEAWTSDENGREKHEAGGGQHGFRCVFPRSN